MKVYLKNYSILLLALFCQQACKQKDLSGSKDINSKIYFDYYIEKGNAAYARKSGLASVAESQLYFDTASRIAYAMNDSLLIAKSIFSKGRVYDAWNKEPGKTIKYYILAANMYGRLDSLYDTHLYIRHLVAHAYDKIPDSANCVKVLEDLYSSVAKMKPKARAQLNFIPEMALISTEVGNYALAKRILSNLTSVEQIKNDPETYNYRDHYLLTMARIQVFDQKKLPYNYVDSLESVYHNCGNTFDSLYYSDQLHYLFQRIGNIDKAYNYLDENMKINAKVTNKADFDTLSKRLAQMEAESERQQSILDRKSNQLWIIIIGCLGLFGAGMVYTNYIFRRSSNKYFKISKELEVANRKSSLLYKELHHRIKNNLHMIFSLLQMQERKSDDPSTIENLKSARLRIESIAVMHEEMMQEEYKVDFKNFLFRMIHAVTECFTFNRQIITHLNIRETEIPQKQSFSLALIINEWISNSIKHARTDGSNLEIFVNIIDEGDYVLIQYYDNGIVDPEMERRTGLGTQIINLLTKQLNAYMINDDLKPYHYSIKLVKK